MNNKDTKAVLPIYQGMWRDVYIYEDGTIEETEWKYNQAQNTSATLAAILFGKTVKDGASSWGGVQYLALGEGDSDWDLSPPTSEDKPYSQSTLLNEIDRIQIANDTNVFFLDPDTEIVSVDPTRMIQINVLIPFSRGNGDLREFALFGGDATSAADSGYMINWVTHTLIENSPTRQILRQIKLKWLTLDEITIL